MISQLNAKAGIDDDLFKRYFTGRDSAQILFRKWSRISMPDNKDTVQGRNSLIFIGLAVEGAITFENAANAIIQTLITK